MGLAPPLSGAGAPMNSLTMGGAVTDPAVKGMGMDPRQKVAAAMMGQQLMQQIGKMAQPGLMPNQDNTRLDLYGNPLR